ncbi:GDCCVxC domain-containing (seleno)protein [Crystallibacter degradans]|uniref:GDCCVxC domain-containing (seleno)protein n=1 Tax=Crystallibacter degradans TaxID=2726743 RepID=UPI00197BA710|nr:GDCCVxC domain-containing (seleno)protein [Arthrobacter sp. SF27]
MTIELVSTLACPACRQETSLQMPADACLFFWTCPACSERVRPVEGDCCVFCSYGTVSCPSKQGPVRDQRSEYGSCC